MVETKIIGSDKAIREKDKEILSKIESLIVMLALPIFTASHPATIVGANELNFCVRDGNRWTLVAINTNYAIGF